MPPLKYNSLSGFAGYSFWLDAIREEGGQPWKWEIADTVITDFFWKENEPSSDPLEKMCTAFDADPETGGWDDVDCESYEYYQMCQ